MTITNFAQSPATRQAKGVNGEWTYIKKHGEWSPF
jgi:hypothetical protein